MRSTFLTGLVLCLLTACSTMSYIGIETTIPAEVTFPESVKKILIVNNAVPQPQEIGYTYSLKGVAQDTCKAKPDSAIVEACRALGEGILEQDYFEDVLLYHLPIRTDDLFYQDKKLTPAQVKRLCMENGTDAIISFDKLLFSMHKNVAAYSAGFLFGSIDIEMSGIVRAYLPERENPLVTILAQDSIRIGEAADNEILLNRILPGPENALREAGSYIGYALYPNFVPYWTDTSRWYYNGMNTPWKEASAFAASDKWDNAFERWSQIHNRSGSWKEKAKAASNMALYYEVKEDLQKAYEWAGQSYELFLKHKGEEYEATKRQKAYRDVLQKRIQENIKLDIQFGKQ